MRLDIYLHIYKGVKSRTLAARLIKGGAVSVSGTVITDAAHDIREGSLDDHITIASADILKYVSRAGLKLEGALQYFSGIDSKYIPKEKICLDVGSSTGGFTDCLLHHGAKEVFAVDVGSQQLDATLRNDVRVHVFENTDIRDFGVIFKKEYAQKKIDYIVADVSFISLTHIIPTLGQFKSNGMCNENVRALLLVKPQFEVGPEHLNKKGIVRPYSDVAAILQQLSEVAVQHGWKIVGSIESTLRGGDGNVEYFLALA